MKCSVCGKDATCFLKITESKEEPEGYVAICNKHEAYKKKIKQ